MTTICDNEGGVTIFYVYKGWRWEVEVDMKRVMGQLCFYAGGGNEVGISAI
jgi:hypothetical protein